MTIQDRAIDPGREIAKFALVDHHGQPGAMLESVMNYAFDQLCFHRTTPQLEAFIEGLRGLIDEDA